MYIFMSMRAWVCIIIDLFQMLGTTGLACLIVSILNVAAFERLDRLQVFDEGSLLVCEYGIDTLPDSPYVEVGH